MMLYEYLSEQTIVEGRPVKIYDYKYRNVLIHFKAPFCDSNIKHRILLDIAKKVDVIEAYPDSVVTNLSDIIERSVNYNPAAFTDIGLSTDISDLMLNINTILSPSTNDFWLVRFIAHIR